MFANLFICSVLITEHLSLIMHKMYISKVVFAMVSLNHIGKSSSCKCSL